MPSVVQHAPAIEHPPVPVLRIGQILEGSGAAFFPEFVQMLGTVQCPHKHELLLHPSCPTKGSSGLDQLRDLFAGSCRHIRRLSGDATPDIEQNHRQFSPIAPGYRTPPAPASCPSTARPVRRVLRPRHTSGARVSVGLNGRNAWSANPAFPRLRLRNAVRGATKLASWRHQSHHFVPEAQRVLLCDAK
jgi:hypothetical protein